MADKKLNQLDPAAGLTVNDIIGLCQNLTTGEMVYESLGVLRSFVLGGANAGARVYFDSGVPDVDLGVAGDVYFDIGNKNIYSNEAGTWVLKDNYGAADAGILRLRFTSVYGAGGLSADGLTYTDANLIDCDIVSVQVDATPLIVVQDWGDTPAFDEFDFDIDTGVIRFGAPLPEGFRITIIYSY